MSKLLSLIPIFLAYILVADRTIKTIPHLHMTTTAEQRRQTLLYPIDAGRPMMGMIAPDFQLQDGYGKKHRLSYITERKMWFWFFTPKTLPTAELMNSSRSGMS